MLSKRIASMIIGISMGLETCQTLGQVSHNLLFWKKNLPTDICGLGRDQRENGLHPGQIICGQSYGRSMGKHAKLKEKQKVVWWKAPSWKSTKIARDLLHRPGGQGIQRNNSRTRVRSWKHQWLLLCRVKLWKIAGVMDPTKLKQNLRAFWKLMILRECVWEIRYSIIIKTI